MRRNGSRTLPKAVPWGASWPYQAGLFATRNWGHSGSYHASQSRVLMVGAGGIGCELLKNLVLTGYGEVHIVDLDTIDLSNLNRQFLFRHEHIKKSKALVGVTPFHVQLSAPTTHGYRLLKNLPQSLTLTSSSKPITRILKILGSM